MQWLTQHADALSSIVIIWWFFYWFNRSLQANLKKAELSLEKMNEKLDSIKNSLSHLEGRVQGHFEAKSVKQFESIPRVEVKRRRSRKYSPPENS